MCGVIVINHGCKAQADVREQWVLNLQHSNEMQRGKMLSPTVMRDHGNTELGSDKALILEYAELIKTQVGWGGRF